METDKHAGEDVEVIEFDEEVSDNSDSDDGGGELSFDPGKDLWVTVTVNKSGHKALDVEEAWNWEVMNIIYFLPSSVPVQSKSSPVGTEISLKFDYYHPPTPGKVEM